MKIILKCKNKQCAYTTTSAQLLQKHQSATHPELRKKRGPKPKKNKKPREEINSAYYAKRKERKLHQKAILHRLLNSCRQRWLRLVLPIWQDNTKPVFAPSNAILMQLDGLPPSRMPPCYTSKPSPQRWGPRPPKPISLATGTSQYKFSLAAVTRKNWPQTPLSFARMRHCKLAKADFHAGDEENPTAAYLAETIYKRSLLKIYKEGDDDDCLSFSSSSRSKSSDWPSEALGTTV